MTSWLIAAYLWLVTAIFALVSLRTLFHLQYVHRLPSRASLADQTLLPSVTVVIAARDEAVRIEDTLLHLLAQSEISLEVIVVDDRSTDGTGEIVRRIAALDPRLKMIRIDSLPEDWLGKCHACFCGALAGTGEWILFTDADCWLASDAITRAVAVALREQADHVALTPGIRPNHAGGAAWHLAFLFGIADTISQVNRDDSKKAIGIGAFNLVRTSAYQACGGYERLRLTVVDDMRLGLLLRRAGFRTRAYLGGDDVICHWCVTIRQAMRLMEKNYFAAIDYRTEILPGIIGITSILWAGALFGPFTGTLPGNCAGVALQSLVIPAMIISRRNGWSLRYAWLVPFVFPLLIGAMLRSAYVTLSQGGIRWRETFYTLEQLRSGQVRW